MESGIPQNLHDRALSYQLIQRLTAGRRRLVEDGWWKTAGGRRLVEDGWWKTAGGRRLVEDGFSGYR
jgi:hypothetical protein